jgi:hypothetical protein
MRSRLPRSSLLAPRAILFALCFGACLPRTGTVEVLADGAGGAPTEGGLLVVDGSTPSPDSTGGPTPDTGAPPPPSDATLAPDSAQPDTLPSGPTPPFGSSVGMTAADFTNIPDCAGNLYSLHSYYNQKKGVLIAMMSPS